MFWTDGTAAGASSGSQSQAAQGAETGAANSQAATAGNNAQGVDTSQFVSKSDFDAIQAKLTKLESDNKKYRDRIRALADDDEESGGKGKGKDSTSAVEEMLSLARKDRFESQITTAAVKAGAAHPELVVRALDIDEVADKNGSVKDAEGTVAKLKEKYPNLFQAQSGNPAINGGNDGSRRPRNSADMNAIIRGARGRSSRLQGAAT